MRRAPWIILLAFVFCAPCASTQESTKSREARELQEELDRLDRAFGWVNRIGETRPSTRPVDPVSARSSAPAGAPAPGATTRPVLAQEDPQPEPATQPATRPVTRPISFAIGQRPPMQPVPLPRQGLSDDEIGRSIERAVDHLIARFDNNGLLRGQVEDRRGRGANDRSYETGLHALAGYALLQAGLAISEDRRLDVKGDFMRKVLDNMKRMNADGTYATYARGIRATALAVHNRADDRDQLRDDCNYLVRNVRGGAYTYGSLDWRANRPNNRIREGDNSNSQYGLLGVWSAVEVGVGEASANYWNMVQGHWAEAQGPEGMWGYMPNFGRGRMGPGGGTYAMTVAGIASLFVTHDYLEAPRVATQVGRPAFSGALAHGLRWLETGDNALGTAGAEAGAGGHGGGYELYGLERVGLASGFKYFGRHDWYRELAAALIQRQKADGSFGDIIETSYCILFLARGRHPVFMNKLRFEGNWANRPRDIANLTRFATRELERPLNWQVVPIDRPWTDFADAPVLCLASHVAPQFSDRDVAAIRDYIEAGGMLFTHADAGSAAFNTFIREFAMRLHPDYELQELPEDHELYDIAFKVPAPRPKLRYMTNGARILWIHSDSDLSSAWQGRAEKLKRPAFDLGVNLFLWATGKQTPRNRLAAPDLPAPRGVPTGIMKIARARYAGNWDPEPKGWQRFARQFHYDTGAALNVEPVSLAVLEASLHPFAHLTGTASHTWTDAEVAAVKKYVEDGGTLFIEPAGGNAAFAAAVNQALLSRAFPAARVQTLGSGHPVLAASDTGMIDLSDASIRPYAVSKVGRDAGTLSILAAGRGRVIISSLDLSTGLTGAQTYAVLGWTPDAARDILRNLILWTWDGAPVSAPDPAGASPPP